MVVELGHLRLRRPDQREDGARLQEQGVGAVVDVLPAEIPDAAAPPLEPHPARRQWRRADLDAVRGRHGVVIRLAAQPAAQLRLSDPAVAEDHELDVGHFGFAGGEVVEMGAQGLEAGRVGVGESTSAGTPGRAAS